MLNRTLLTRNQCLAALPVEILGLAEGEIEKIRKIIAWASDDSTPTLFQGYCERLEVIVRVSEALDEQLKNLKLIKAEYERSLLEQEAYALQELKYQAIFSYKEDALNNQWRVFTRLPKPNFVALKNVLLDYSEALRSIASADLPENLKAFYTNEKALNKFLYQEAESKRFRHALYMIKINQLFEETKAMEMDLKSLHAPLEIRSAIKTPPVQVQSEQKNEVPAAEAGTLSGFKKLFIAGKKLMGIARADVPHNVEKVYVDPEPPIGINSGTTGRVHTRLRLPSPPPVPRVKKNRRTASLRPQEPHSPARNAPESHNVLHQSSTPILPRIVAVQEERKRTRLGNRP